MNAVIKNIRCTRQVTEPSKASNQITRTLPTDQVSSWLNCEPSSNLDATPPVKRKSQRDTGKPNERLEQEKVRLRNG